MKYGMPTLIECGDLEENARLCHELGLSFVELSMNLPQYQTAGRTKKHFLKPSRRENSSRSGC